MNKKLLFASALSILGTVSAQSVSTEGLDILLIGDFGWTPDMSDPIKNFDAINSYVGNWTQKGGKIDFFMTAGDNIYVKDEERPTFAEADTVMDLFRNRTNLKNLDIWAIRGNHDCYALDAYFEVNLTKRYQTWKMPDLFYNKTFDLGNGKKFLVLFVDSCFAICANQTYAQGTGGSLMSESPILDEEGRRLLEEMVPKPARMNRRLKDVRCGDDWATDQGNKMFTWINNTLEYYKNDPTVIWKATIQHHPIFGKWYSDYVNITANYLPIMLDHKVDFYLNGHEHTLEYAYYPYNQVIWRQLRNQQPHGPLKAWECVSDQELFFGYNSRYSEFPKGEALHQFTIGSSGYDLYQVCPTKPSMGRYRFLNNKQHGFAHMKVTEREFAVHVIGINQATQETTELYKVSVINDGNNNKAKLFEEMEEAMLYQ